MNTTTTLPSAQYLTSKRRETLKTRQQTLPVQQPPTSFYNLKDFLPQSSTLTLQNKANKPRSTIIPQTSFILKANPHQNLVQNVQERLIQQKMNKLKDANNQLQQTVDDQKLTISQQQHEINRLKMQLNDLKLAEQAKAKRLSIWNYKYHAQYAPKQIQTIDETFSRGIGSGPSHGLRAKDFEDIYKRLNTSAPSDEMKKKGPKDQGITNSNLFSNTITRNRSTNIGSKNQSMVMNAPNNKSTLKLTKFFMQNRSSTGNLNREVSFGEQSLPNKQNMMGMSNFDMNPMSINLEKITNKQKPIKQQCIEIYPIDQGYLDGIIGEILCGDDD